MSHVSPNGSPTPIESDVAMESRSWEAAENALNPMNWTSTWRWLIIINVSYIEFLTHLTSLMFAPSLPQVQTEFSDAAGTLSAMSMTIYVLGFAFGPIVIAPLSELYGRVGVYRCCTIGYLLLTVACALSSSLDILIAFRFFAGCIGGAPVAIGGAIVSDLFPSNRRGNAMGLYQVGPVLGPLLGPIIGGYIAQERGWRWVFWIATMLAGVAAASSFLVLRETHHATIMRRTSASLKLHWETAQPIEMLETSSGLQSSLMLILRTTRRPLQLLLSSPIIFACCMIPLLVFGIMNVVYSTLGMIYQERYHFSTGASGLAYMGMALGSVMGAFLSAQTSDRVQRVLTKKHDGNERPEYRMPLAGLGALLIAGGLCCYGWSAEASRPWMVPLVGLGMLGLGLTTVHLAIQLYLVDAYTSRAASVLAAATMTRSLGGALVPLAGPSVYRTLGLGWGNSLFAFLNLSISFAVVAIYKYGPPSRQKRSPSHISEI